MNGGVSPGLAGDLDQVLPRVLRDTARAMGWRHDAKPTLNGFGPGDIVGIAMAGVLDGHRTWNPRKYPTFQLFLTSVVQSVLHGEREKARRHAGRRLTAEPADHGPGPLTSSASAEEAAELIARCDAAGVPAAFVRLWLENPRISNLEVSDITATTVREVENAKKRARRLLRARGAGESR